MKHYTSRLALHVVSAVFFRKSLTWKMSNDGTDPVPPGRTMRYDQALFTVIKSLPIIFLTPRALRGVLPFQSIRRANAAFADWTEYMKELQGDSMTQPEKLLLQQDKSILEHITLAGTIGSSQTGDKPLPKESILGNIFMVLLSGHETTGNAMAFALLLLTIYPEYQKKVQEEIDQQQTVRPRKEWTVEQEYPKFQNGWIGAVLKETLRVYSVVPYIPRKVVAPLTLVDSNGRSYAIPENTMCGMHFAAAFRNPTTWPPRRDVSAARRAQLHHSPAIDFNPVQWLNTGDVTGASEGEDGSVPRLFPFGQGPRHCPGRLFAEVEMTAVLATILAECDLELIVDEEAKQTYGERAAWERARDQAMLSLVDDVSANIALQFLKELPIRVRERS